MVKVKIYAWCASCERYRLYKKFKKKEFRKMHPRTCKRCHSGG